MTKAEMDAMIANGKMTEFLESRSVIEDDEFDYLIQKGIISLDQATRPMSSSEYMEWIEKITSGVFEPVIIQSSFASFSLVVADCFLDLFKNTLPKEFFVALAKRAYNLDDNQNMIYEKLKDVPMQPDSIEITFMNCFYNIRQWCSDFSVTMEATHNIHPWFSFGVARLFLIPFFRWTIFKKRVMYWFRKIKSR